MTKGGGGVQTPPKKHDIIKEQPQCGFDHDCYPNIDIKIYFDLDLGEARQDVNVLLDGKTARTAKEVWPNNIYGA